MNGKDFERGNYLVTKLFSSLTLVETSEVLPLSRTQDGIPQHEVPFKNPSGSSIHFSRYYSRSCLIRRSGEGRARGGSVPGRATFRRIAWRRHAQHG